MRREFGDIETASCLMLCATRMHRVHHVQCGAAGVNGLLIAALTALTHADRPRHRRAVWRHRESQLPAAQHEQMVQPVVVQRLWI